jgi:spore maturation protein CgeB
LGANRPEIGIFDRILESLSRLLYIGQYTEGTTSKMRADTLKEIFGPGTFEVIDTHIPFYGCHSFWRSLAFRWKWGKVIWKTNRYILDHLSGSYDAIWVDKSVFINKETTQKLKYKTKCLIHYTPDAAFKENASRYFYKSIPHYDFLITTKSFEREDYLKYIQPRQLIFVPQGYNQNLHYPRHHFSHKKPQVLFIGLYESSRAQVIEALLQEQIPVVLAGKNWGTFVVKNRNRPLTYLGEGLFGEAYAQAVSESQFGLGLVSKRFPELHTTRTFEIPACGTALVTEFNEETAQFYENDEVIFFRDTQELVEKIKFYLNHPKALQILTEKGCHRVVANGLSYQKQLTEICKVTGILPPISQKSKF